MSNDQKLDFIQLYNNKLKNGICLHLSEYIVLQ